MYNLYRNTHMYRVKDMKLIKGLNSPTLQQYLAAGSTALLLNIDSTTVSLTFDPNTLEQRSLYQRAHTDNKQREQVRIAPQERTFNQCIPPFCIERK